MTFVNRQVWKKATGSVQFAFWSQVGLVFLWEQCTDHIQVEALLAKQDKAKVANPDTADTLQYEEKKTASVNF